ncbi:MAG TPA: sulfatase-like hydrolase/transferase [Pirellulaceae bacterium]|jgi:arylsulfatase A|nr:sulfatase-like hydrolase/transferase [Pirellulaceae bacterium]
MHRRFAILSLIYLSLAGPVLLFAAEGDAANASRPNILILYADDLGYGDLGCYSEKSKIPTPHLDRLASQGKRFTDAHSSSGICTPSRYALLTGRHHWRDFHNIVNAFEPSVFRPERLTMPEMLREKGYATACIGKWHLGWDWRAIRKAKGEAPEAFVWSQPIPDGPLAHGFDSYFGDDVINFPPYAWIENDRVVTPPTESLDTTKWKPIKEGNWECRPGPMVAGWDPYAVLPTLTERGVDYLKSRKDRTEPFFLYFAFPSPHAPIIPNDEYDGVSGAGPFGDFVAETDAMVGKLLAALEASGHAQNTLVVFTADNGPEHYAYARDAKFEHWSPEPLRGLKRDIYEGGHRVPFLVRWPGVVKPGTTSDALASQIDLLATFASIVDCELPDDAAEDSHDLLPLLRGEPESIRTTHVHNTNPNVYAVRHGNWLLIAALNGYHSKGFAPWEKRRDYPADDNAPVELYDLSKDLGQRQNVAADHPDVVEELKSSLKQIREQGHSAPRLAEGTK